MKKSIPKNAVIVADDLETIKVITFKGNLEQDISFKPKQSFIRLFYLLEVDNFSIYDFGSSCHIALKKNQWYVFPHVANHQYHYRINSIHQLSFLFVNLSKEKYASYLNSLNLVDPLNGERKGKICEPYPINHAINNCIQEILYTNIKHASISNAYRSLKTKELLLLSLMEVEKILSNTKSIQQIEVEEKMNDIKTYLDNNLEQEHSLKDLSALINSNPTYLKKHFKACYQTTVFEYLHQSRMNKAIYLLEQNQDKILDIANQVGFKHATHFTKSFKSHFGTLPKDYRQKQSLVLEK